MIHRLEFAHLSQVMEKSSIAEELLTAFHPHQNPSPPEEVPDLHYPQDLIGYSSLFTFPVPDCPSLAFR
ncbi:hypothetical protein AVEN_153479-1 [Araneus ventricosus]|uniref:Uncharacterized protein n=1 Tax=Araneus ventricosus TaxID=182803 RepID=A0A4Y2K5G0_ARAVE|nr:hypothetical protein AVEN_153479-1 [Araneus ventricosus]